MKKILGLIGLLTTGLLLVLPGCQLTETKTKTTAPVKSVPQAATSTPATTPKASSDKSLVEVKIDSAMRDGSTILFEGSTNLPDGALIAYEIRKDYGDEALPANPWLVEGNTPVQNGHFGAKTGGAPDGRIEVWAAFQTVLSGANQPQSIIDKYGPMGEKILGGDKAGDMIRVEATATVQ